MKKGVELYNYIAKFHQKNKVCAKFGENRSKIAAATVLTDMLMRF